MSDVDAPEGEDIERGTGATGGLPDDGIEGKGDGTGEGGKTVRVKPVPPPGRPEGDEAVGIIQARLG
jgi:hypothetical protein